MGLRNWKETSIYIGKAFGFVLEKDLVENLIDYIQENLHKRESLLWVAEEFTEECSIFFLIWQQTEDKKRDWVLRAGSRIAEGVSF